MNKNNFLSSIWFRCISVLLLISCISGILLATLNDLLYVSADERTARAIKQIYGEEKQYETILDSDFGSEKIVYDEFGEISKVFIIGDKSSNDYDYLILSTGYNGYKNGTITLWVQIKMSDNQPKINAVSYSSNKKQTLMSKFSKQYYDFFTEDFIADIENGKYFAPVLSKDAIGHPNTGATKSANAVCNAINVVIEYVWKNNFEGGL